LPKHKAKGKMNLKYTSALFIACLFLFVSCKKYKHEEFGRDLAKTFKSKKYKDFDTTAYYHVFKKQLVKEKERIHNPKWISKMYEEEEKGLTLIGDFLINGELDTLSRYLKLSVFHGLNPSYFHAKEIDDLLHQVKTKKFKKVEESYPLLASLEILSADALINYSNILKYGAVNPKNIFGRYYVSVKRPDFIDSHKTLDQLQLANFLKDIQPKNGYYQRLQNLLINEQPEQALSANDKQKIYFSLERLRWPTKEYSGKYLLVNIPEFKLRMIENNTTDLEMKVCVGETAYAPFSKDGKNHETPILSGSIDRMQVNPVWNIPKSIAGKEIMVSLQSNPNYLEEHNMVAYNQAGEVVDARAIDWSTASVADYAFKQNPGADNSLGQIKFIFQNPYAIYLHDTPAKAMFQEKNRAVSHGCVRVEKPMKLAAFLLNNDREAQRIEKETQAAAKGEEIASRWVKIKEPVKVFIAYYTAWTNDSGKLIIADDVYGYDAKLKPYLAKYLLE